jgi:hypothetical protein
VCKFLMCHNTLKNKYFKNSVWIFLKKIMFSYYAILTSFETISSIVCKIAFVVYWVRIMVHNATFNNISVISWPVFFLLVHKCFKSVACGNMCFYLNFTAHINRFRSLLSSNIYTNYKKNKTSLNNIKISMFFQNNTNLLQICFSIQH